MRLTATNPRVIFETISCNELSICRGLVLERLESASKFHGFKPFELFETETPLPRIKSCIRRDHPGQASNRRLSNHKFAQIEFEFLIRVSWSRFSNWSSILGCLPRENLSAEMLRRRLLKKLYGDPEEVLLLVSASPREPCRSGCRLAF